MKVKIIKAKETGFCFGVRRALSMLEKEAREHCRIEALGSVVHNERVTQRLSQMGIEVINSLDEIKSDTVAISSHGVSPEVEAELRSRKISLIDTTCPFVKRVQLAARKLAEAGFFVIVYGDAAHPEVKGILGWAPGKSSAALDARSFNSCQNIPRRIGILAQTTQVPENFVEFVKDTIDLTLRQDSEIRVLDTICHDVRQRQSFSLELAPEVDLMLVIGGLSSANTARLREICSKVTETYQIGGAEEINPEWLVGKKKIGVTSGTSTPEETIDEVLRRLEALSD
jgi:4-hydroxy-3-methylbut-2-enyl diphosphate reductase